MLCLSSLPAGDGPASQRNSSTTTTDQLPLGASNALWLYGAHSTSRMTVACGLAALTGKPWWIVGGVCIDQRAELGTVKVFFFNVEEAVDTYNAAISRGIRVEYADPLVFPQQKVLRPPTLHMAAFVPRDWNVLEEAGWASRIKWVVKDSALRAMPRHARARRLHVHMRMHALLPHTP